LFVQIDLDALVGLGGHRHRRHRRPSAPTVITAIIMAASREEYLFMFNWFLTEVFVLFE